MSDLEPIRDVEFRNAVNELREMIKKSDLENISCYCSGCDTILDFGSFNINFDATGIWCYDYFNHKTIWIDETIPFKKVKSYFKEEAQLTLPNSSFKLYFLENFEDIKKTFERKMKEAETNKYLGMSEIDEIITEFSQETEKPKPLPPINMIDFGYRTVEIITNGNVVLVDKRKEQPKLIDVESLLISQLMYNTLTGNTKGVKRCHTQKKKQMR